MKLEFNIIEDFLSVRTKCIFCTNNLVPVLTNWHGIKKPGLPMINSRLKNDEFNFTFTYASAYSSFGNKLKVNTKTNLISKAIKPEEFPLEVNNNIYSIVSSLGMAGLHIELQCQNTECQFDYYISTSQFRFGSYGDYGSPDSMQILPFHLQMEAFVIRDFWVCNDWHLGQTTINGITGNSETIKVPFIDFYNLDKDRIINKIRTVVNFS